MVVPTQVTGDQIRTAVQALGLDGLEFESIRSITIEPHAVAVTMLRRGEGLDADGGPATETIDLGVRWS